MILERVKVVVQIPCLNEAETLPAAVANLPHHIEGVDQIETLVIDDGSSDGTVAVAKALGIDHIVRHTRNLGLARAFATGLETSLRLGADVIVNTDGDNQYPAESIGQLVAPILAGEADIVVADRQVSHVAHFSPVKKGLQALGSWMVRAVSGTEVLDAPSGFRAYSREAALRLHILTRYSYTLETIIQAGKMGMRLVSVPVITNPPTRPSRLQRNAWHFIKAQASTILRLYAFYEPLRTFSYLALPFLLTGLILLGRFGYFFLIGERGIGRFAQSVTIGIGMLLVGVIVALFGIQADIASKHRQLTQEMLYRLRKMDLERPREPGEQWTVQEAGALAIIEKTKSRS
ncbi:MAG: glycosyltransferase family 2 protein [Candidatus Promineifilaceae bacterium]|nr:glycosyltransferase family 2 protein [Candidatus Promineifilaceae bacterium]